MLASALLSPAKAGLTRPSVKTDFVGAEGVTQLAQFESSKLQKKSVMHIHGQG